jgi:parallel beta-helix repeat protein
MRTYENNIRRFLTCVLSLSVTFFPSISFGATICVPSEYLTIQAAIDVASDGDTVLIADGTYTGSGNINIDFGGKAITVQSENGPDNCVVDCNGHGRGVYFHSSEGTDSVVSGLTIIGGWADEGGGIYCSQSSPTITNCVISGNSICLGCYGGGIYLYQSSPTITNCIISDNRAVNTAFGPDCGDGGGIYCDEQSSPTITQCTISENIAWHNGGGIYCRNSCPIITNCVISGNEASLGNGGGVYLFGSSPTITNCTIAENTACSSSDKAGDGIFCAESSPAITNSIVWGEICGRAPSVTYCDVLGGYEGEGNIDVDPLFVGSNDYHLTASSPCINAGTSEGAANTDIDGDSRPQGSHYDIGADEYLSGKNTVGYMVTSDLWIRAVIQTVEKGPVEAIWRKGGEDTTSRGDNVIWGYFYANPSDVDWGSQNNPDLFVKIWFDVSGRVDVNFFHASVPDIEVYSDYPYDGTPDEQGTTTTDTRYIGQYYESGQSYSTEQTEDGNPPSGYSQAGNPTGYSTINDLRIGAIIDTEEKGSIDAIWQSGGQDTTTRGDQVVWGHFYASPSDVTWGSSNNPDLFMKIWFDVSGRVDVNFFHVSVPDIEVYSALPDDGTYDQKGTTIMDNRYIRHEY